MTETATAAEAAASKDASHEHPVKWGWILAQGIVTLILGTIAFYFATVATLATVYMFGGLMGAAGIIQIAESIADDDHKWSQRLTNALIGIVYIVTSMLIFIDPLAASVALTIIIAALFIAIGVIRIVTAWRNRSKGWSWLWLALFGLVNIGSDGVHRDDHARLDPRGRRTGRAQGADRKLTRRKRPWSWE